MHWQIPLILSIIISYFLAPYLIKKIAGLPSRSRNLVWQYFFAASFATIIAFVGGAELFNNAAFLLVIAIGAFNAFGCYCHWCAVDISLSKTSLFTQADDFIALLLGYLILHEANFLSPLLGVGIAFCLGSVFIFVCNKWRTKQSIGKIAKWVAYYSIIWGIATFSMRYFALNGMQLLSYVAAWYEGSLLGACIVFVLSGRKEKGESLKFRQIIKIIPLSLTIMTALMFVCWTFSLAPITVAQPVRQVAEMIFPTIVGLWIFKEIKHLNKLTRLGMIVGLVGGIIIMFSFR